MGLKHITPIDVFKLQQESGAIVIIDVRESDEFEQLSSPLAQNFPLSKFDFEDFAKDRNRRTPIFVLCRSGRRSLSAAKQLVRGGFECVYNVEGGMIEWEASGLPVVKN